MTGPFRIGPLPPSSTGASLGSDLLGSPFYCRPVAQSPSRPSRPVAHPALLFTRPSRRYRRPVWIERGFTDRGRHPVDELVGRRMLDPLGFVVHAIARIAERGRQ